MLKRNIVPLLLALIAFAAGAQESVSVPGPKFVGSATAGFADFNLLRDPFVADVPGLTGGLFLADVELIFSATATRGGIDRTWYEDQYRVERTFGYEAGLKFDLAELLAVESATYEADFDADTSGYPEIQRMIDWYVDNRERYGMAAIAWPTTSYGASSGRYRFIYGNTAEPIEWVSWTQDKWSDARALYTDLRDAILGAIENISGDVTSGSGDPINQYAFRLLTAEQQEAVLQEMEAYTRFEEYVFGSDSTLSIGGVKVKAAWLSLTNLFGLLDLRFDFLGSALSTGALVRSPRASQDEAGSSLRLALAPGFVPGLSFSITAAASGGIESVVEDYNTKTMEWYPGESSWIGAKLAAAYDFERLIGHELSVSLELLAPDLLVRPEHLAASLGIDYELRGALSVDAALELDAILWNDRYLEGDPSELSLAFGADFSADWLGFGLEGAAAFKQYGYGGWGGNLLEDRFDGVSLWGDFDAAKAGNALGAELGVDISPAAFLGMDLGALRGGYRILVYGVESLAMQGAGWYGELELRTHELLGLPLALTLGAERWTNNGLVSYADSGAWPLPGLLDDVSWTASLVWDPTERFEVELSASGAESGWKVDTSQVVSLGLYSTIKF
ncbi:MAG: hypothetical protein JXA15_11165 [Spirochaetales bacterium]|nr:hypothetical protein [Spirochaetales bacterium]